MILHQWAIKHNIPLHAVEELKQLMGFDPLPIDEKATTETGVLKRERLAIAQEGGLLWRNNVGACMDSKGNYILYGLAHDSQAMNKNIKSSDGIGIKPVLITQAHVGSTIGQFVAREAKKPGWVFTGTARENAQLKFIELVIARGGDAKFIC